MSAALRPPGSNSARETRASRVPGDDGGLVGESFDLAVPGRAGIADEAAPAPLAARSRRARRVGGDAGHSGCVGQGAIREHPGQLADPCCRHSHCSAMATQTKLLPSAASSGGAVGTHPGRTAPDRRQPVPRPLGHLASAGSYNRERISLFFAANSSSVRMPASRSSPSWRSWAMGSTSAVAAGTAAAGGTGAAVVMG